jgi:hypothetical protein
VTARQTDKGRRVRIKDHIQFIGGRIGTLGSRVAGHDRCYTVTFDGPYDSGKPLRVYEWEYDVLHEEEAG